MKKYSSVLILLFLCGCAAAPVQETPALGIDGVACVGRIPAVLQGLTPAANDELVAIARAPSNEGRVCAAAAYTASEPLRVYRVYDSSRGDPSFGPWWSLSPPGGSRDQYRASYAICPEWSALDRLAVCRLKPGSVIVLGTTQSAYCSISKATYEKTADIQVYIPNDWKTGVTFVEDCVEEPIWPELKQAATE